MKRTALTVILVGLALTALPAAELQTADGASITVRTRTEFDLSIDHPDRFGLATSVPELSLNFTLSPWQKVGDLPHASQPQGFLQFDLDKLEIRYNNGAQPDYNAPSGQGAFDFKFNDPHASGGKTGYFGPAYLPNLRSGIVWGDWILQLAARGAVNFNNPWNRDYDHAYQGLTADWAYLDTRVQFRRTPVETYLADLQASPPKETNYWSYDATPNPFDKLTTDASTGSLIALEYGGKVVAGRLKVNTRYTLADLPDGETNGFGLGGDLSVSPFPGFVSTTSVASRLHYVGDASPEVIGAGTKLAYEIPLAGLKGLSLSPVLGYDLSAGLSGDRTLSHEASAALSLRWPGTEGWAYDFLQDRTGTVSSGLTVAYKLFQADATSTAYSHEVLVTLYEDPGDAGLVKGLGSEIVVEGHDLGSTARSVSVSAYFDGTFKAGKAQLVPWTRIFYDWHASPDNQLMASVGIKFDKFIAKTLIGLTWDSHDLIPGTPSAGYGTAKLYADISL